MIQKIECFRPKTEVRTFAELKALPQRQIKLREAKGHAAYFDRQCQIALAAARQTRLD